MKAFKAIILHLICSMIAFFIWNLNVAEAQYREHNWKVYIDYIPTVHITKKSDLNFKENWSSSSLSRIGLSLPITSHLGLDTELGYQKMESNIPDSLPDYDQFNLGTSLKIEYKIPLLPNTRLYSSLGVGVVYQDYEYEAIWFGHDSEMEIFTSFLIGINQPITKKWALSSYYEWQTVHSYYRIRSNYLGFRLIYSFKASPFLDKLWRL